jgi:hypothetical protein
MHSFSEQFLHLTEASVFIKLHRILQKLSPVRGDLLKICVPFAVINSFAVSFSFDHYRPYARCYIIYNNISCGYYMCTQREIISNISGVLYCNG